MTPPDAPPADPALELDGLLAPFESARARGEADLAAFLPPSDHPQFLAALRELVRLDLEFGWDSGTRPCVEAYTRRFPVLADDPAALRAVAWEEFRLRQAAGEAPTAAEYRDRFGIDLSEDAGAPDRTLPCEVVPSGPARMPEPGEHLLGFEVVSELGRGAFGRVFLARQADLADRFVVLKLSSAMPGESQTLARLQHANIVPVYSAHRHGPYHVLCMPFLGATTLADVLDTIRSRPDRPRSGKDLVSTLAIRAASTVSTEEVPSTDGPVGLPTPRPAAEAMAKLDFVGSVLWLGAELADGLAHAHERGIVHRDVKPANVLLTDEGRPMLLDFNLAADFRAPTGTDGVGGTLRYMAPEALAAMADRKTAVGPAADVYALGLMLFELLTGRFPFAEHRGSLREVLQAMTRERKADVPDAARFRSDVSPATTAILAKCLAPDPAARYPTAAELREDLRRQLDDRPLRFAPNPSLRERARKWARRHPRLSSSVTLSVVAGVVITAALLFAVWRQAEVSRLTAQRLLDGTEQKLERLRPLVLTPNPSAEIPEAQLREARSQAKELLDQWGGHRGWRSGLFDKLNSADRERASGRIAETLALGASANQALAQRSRDPGERTKLLTEADELRRAAEAIDRSAAQGEYMAAVADLGAGRVSEAATRFEHVVRQEPRSSSAWLALADAQMRQGRWDAADRSLTAALAVEPGSPWGYFRRGVCALNRARFADAERDFTSFLEARPDVPEARLNLALALHGQARHVDAVAELNRLEQSGANLPRVYFVRETAKRALGDRAGADADLALGLKREPTDPLGYNARGEARLRTTTPDPNGALADFQTALELDPGFRPGWENVAHVNSEHLARPVDAVAALDRAVALHPDYVLARAGRGVLLARLGKADAARADASDVLKRDDSALTLYQAACIVALTARGEADRTEVIRLLRAAIRKDAAWARSMPADPDLASVRSSDGFRRLMMAAAEVAK